MANYTSIRLEVTSQCNLKCLCCHNLEYLNRQDDLTTEEILKLLTNLKCRYDIKKVLLTGGEPLKQPDIFRIIKYITDMGIKVDMVTNGILLNYSVMKKLEQSGLKRIRISIDEINPISDLRGKISSDSLWKKAEMIINNSNIEVCIHTVASPNNLEQLFSIYKKVVYIGARRWRVFDIGYQGGVEENKARFNFKSYYHKLIETTANILKDYLDNNLKEVLDIEINNIFRTIFLNLNSKDIDDFDLINYYKEKLEKSPCDYVADHQITIRSDGTSTLCQYFHNTIFDYKKYDFNVREAMKRKEYTVENEIRLCDIESCKKCKYCLLCNSGCRSRTLFLTGDIKDADPVGCYLHKMVYENIVSILPPVVQKFYNKNLLPNGKEPKYSEQDLEKFLISKGYDIDASE